MKTNAYLVCNSGTVKTRLWLYCTSSENSNAKLLNATSPLPRLSGLSKMLVRGRLDDIANGFCLGVGMINELFDGMLYFLN